MLNNNWKKKEFTSNRYHSVLFQWGFKDLRQTSVLCVILPNFISTNASVVSLARSITGRFRPANTLTFIFPGIFTYSHTHLTLKQQFIPQIQLLKQHYTSYYHVFHTRLALPKLPNQSENKLISYQYIDLYRSLIRDTVISRLQTLAKLCLDHIISRKISYYKWKHRLHYGFTIEIFAHQISFNYAFVL